jgi:hypothetical protein
MYKNFKKAKKNVQKFQTKKKKMYKNFKQRKKNVQKILN